MPGPRVFISHSSSDRQFVEALVNALEASLRLARGDIRCTSLPGYKLEGGARTPDAIRADIETADFVLGVLSRTGERSDWVRFELGAAWALRRRLVPILIDLGYEDLPEPVRDLNALRASEEHDVLQLVDDIAAGLNAVKEPLPRILQAVRQVTAASRRGPTSAPRSTREPRPSAAPSVPALEDDAIRFLRIFAERDLDGVTPDEVGRAIGISDQKARYLADKLEKSGHLYDTLVVGEPTTYGLSGKGRAFLIEAGHIK